jgi:hypothetical protein
MTHFRLCANRLRRQCCHETKGENDKKWQHNRQVFSRLPVLSLTAQLHRPRFKKSVLILSWSMLIEQFLRRPRCLCVIRPRLGFSRQSRQQQSDTSTPICVSRLQQRSILMPSTHVISDDCNRKRQIKT